MTTALELPVAAQLSGPKTQTLPPQRTEGSVLPAAWDRPIVPDWQAEYHFSPDRLTQAEASRTNAEGLLAYAALHTLQHYDLRNTWGYDRKVEGALESRFGNRGNRVYQDIISHMPGVNIVTHRALDVEIEARMSVQTANGLEAVFYMRDNGRQAADAADLRSRWLRHDDASGAIIAPDQYAPSAHRLAYNVATLFGGQVIVSSGEHGLVVSGDGDGPIHAEDVTALPSISNNLVVVSLPYAESTAQHYPPLYLVPDLDRSAV